MEGRVERINHNLRMHMHNTCVDYTHAGNLYYEQAQNEQIASMHIYTYASAIAGTIIVELHDIDHIQ